MSINKEFCKKTYNKFILILHSFFVEFHSTLPCHPLGSWKSHFCHFYDPRAFGEAKRLLPSAISNTSKWTQLMNWAKIFKNYILDAINVFAVRSMPPEHQKCMKFGMFKFVLFACFVKFGHCSHMTSYYGSRSKIISTTSAVFIHSFSRTILVD